MQQHSKQDPITSIIYTTQGRVQDLISMIDEILDWNENLGIRHIENIPSLPMHEG